MQQTKSFSRAKSKSMERKCHPMMMISASTLRVTLLLFSIGGILGGDSLLESFSCSFDTKCEIYDPQAARAAGFLVPNDSTKELPFHPYIEQTSSEDGSGLCFASDPVAGATASPCNESVKIPVACARNQCLYDNYCLARAANFNPFFCESFAGCPVNGTYTEAVSENCDDEAPSSMHRIGDEGSVSCGEANCTYQNMCYAKVAGFSEDDCVPMDCPYADPTPCIHEPSNPVNCGNCYYGNQCLANQAGFDWKCIPMNFYTDVSAARRRLFRGANGFQWRTLYFTLAAMFLTTEIVT